jgi:hypothetical protein
LKRQRRAASEGTERRDELDATNSRIDRERTDIRKAPISPADKQRYREQMLDEELKPFAPASRG